jgi:hypothetical protein
MAKKHKNKNPCRPRKNADMLMLKLMDWRRTLFNPSHTLIRPPSWIRSDKALKSLTLAHPDCITSAEDVTQLLSRSQTFHEEYAMSLWSVIVNHNDTVPIQRVKRTRTTNDKENDPIPDDYHSQAWRREQQALSHIHNPENGDCMTQRQRAIKERNALKESTITT